MIKQGLGNQDILEKKFKILRTSILLGNVKDRVQMLDDYQMTALEVDKLRRGLYEEKVASKMYTTTSIEEEASRLKDLIKIIEDRINDRNKFIDDYIKITNNYLDDIPRVQEEEELAKYQVRLDNILEFLNNSRSINELNERLAVLRDNLEEKYENKANSELINAKLEDELIDEFNKFVTSNSYYAGLNYPDIESELSKIDNSLVEKYDVMNTFISSYEALKNAGISGAEREEYLSYVNDSKQEYYNELEKKYILNIYKLVLDKENNYERLYEKRNSINDLLNDRAKKRLELNIDDRDQLNYFASLCDEQFSVIKSQKFNIESIDKLIVEISECESKLEELENANKRDEIVALLEEYATDSPNAIKITLPDENEIRDSIHEEAVKDNTIYEPNVVIRVSEPVKINVPKAVDTAKLVMKKVVIVLEPKKFNNRRDKIKEAEEALAREKALKEEEQKKQENEFITMDIGNETASTEDDIFIDYKQDGNKPLTINLEEFSNNEEAKEVKIDVPKNGTVSIPTEIFIEEEKPEKPKELFSETDPFLDDNMFEGQNQTESFVSGMPIVDNIGTVKPNSLLDKINEASSEADDIIMPTMGLTDKEKVDVPIDSEKYIKE